ncbi:MAG: sulfatase [Victivallaceae bacterium]
MHNQRPNIILIVADDHGRESLGCYGNPVIKTPNLDKLANDGVRFTNAFCTSASCSASRSVILTGLHNHTNGTFGHTHGVHHFSCYDNIVSLPKILNQSNYRTACIGKRHFAPEEVYPFQLKIEDYGQTRDDVAMAEASREFLSGDKPFFLYYCSFNPHRDGRTVGDGKLAPNSFGNPEHDFPGDKEKSYDNVIVPSFLNDTPAVRAELAQYYQSISRMDRGVGRLIEILKENNIYDNTLIIYISDNGAAFPMSKTNLYEPGMHLPCIFKLPGETQSANSVCDVLTAWYDITPTILDYAGVNSSGYNFFGSSIRPMIEGKKNLEDWPEEVYASHSFHQLTNYYPMRVVRTKKYKFIYNIAHPRQFPFASDLWISASWRQAKENESDYLGKRLLENYLHRPQFELYDLENDQDELRNLAELPEYIELVESFKNKIKKFQQDTNDPWFHKWEYE